MAATVGDVGQTHFGTPGGPVWTRSVVGVHFLDTCWGSDVMKLLFTSSMTAMLLLSGCASIDAGEEVKDLQGATSTFADALRAVDSEEDAALRSVDREALRSAVMEGGSVRFSETCEKQAQTVLDNYRIAAERAPYDWKAVDRAYAGMNSIKPCDVVDLAEDRLPSAVTPDAPLEFGPIMATGADDLSGTASKLEAYVEALADVATGETAAKADAARDRLISAGTDLLGAFQISGAQPFVDFGSQILGSIMAAKRNAATRKFLDEMDPYMPAMMERTGLAARLLQATAAKNRASAAYLVARTANRRLAGRGLKPAELGRYMNSHERIERYDDAVSVLAVHNGAVANLVSSDPMIAARAFAESHRALRDIYHDPKANRKAILEGLAKFQDAAVALYEALKKTPGGAEAG